MKFKKKIIDIAAVVKGLGHTISTSLPHIHALTGCETTTFKYCWGKIYTLTKVIGYEHCCSLFSNLGVEPEPDEAVIKAASKFLQVAMYSGEEEEEESYLQTRVLVYKSSKNKLSCALPPDPKSAKEEIKRCHLQVRIWISCTSKDPFPLSLLIS